MGHSTVVGAQWLEHTVSWWGPASGGWEEFATGSGMFRGSSLVHPASFPWKECVFAKVGKGQEKREIVIDHLLDLIT